MKCNYSLNLDKPVPEYALPANFTTEHLDKIANGLAYQTFLKRYGFPFGTQRSILSDTTGVSSVAVFTDKT